MPNGITINQNTTLQQVGEFLGNDPNKDRQLLARTNKQGEVVLYARPQASGVLDKISHFIDRQLGRTERREARARDALLGLVNRYETSHTETDKTKGLFKNIKEAITNWSASRQMSGHVVSLLSLATRGLPVRTEQPLPPGPTLSSLGIAKDSSLIRDTARKLGTDPTDEDHWYAVAKELGEELVGQISALNPESVRDEFAMSDGVRFMTGLSEALGEAMGKLAPPVEVSKDTLDTIVQSAFLTAASKIRNDGVLPGQGKQIKGEEVPPITIGGQRYEPTRQLGMGGFGRVYEYVAVDDPTKKIALKVSFEFGQKPIFLHGKDQSNYAESLRAAASETNFHREVFGSGVNEIVGYKTHFRMPDGNIAIAMESAPNGNVEDMGKTLKEAVDKGTLSQSEANVLRLTMLQDMTKGLGHMHAEDIAHLDFKGQNCLIGTDGTAKVSDFGLTRGLKFDENGPHLRHMDLIVPDNNLYLSPEQLSAKTTVWDSDKTASGQIRSKIEQVVTQLAKIFPNGTKPRLLEALAGNVLETPISNINDRSSDLKAGLKYDSKVDVWGLGMAAIELFSGNRPFLHADSLVDVDEALLSFGKNPNNEPLSDPIKKTKLEVVPPPSGNGPGVKVEVEMDVPKPGSLALKTGVGQIDDLMTQMLRPRPEDRSEASQLLKHSAFGMPGVGSKEARDLIVAIKSGDADKIAEARRALQGLVSPSAEEEHILTMEEVKELTGGSMPPLPQTPRPTSLGEEDEKRSV